jgi:hypothetical protein
LTFRTWISLFWFFFFIVDCINLYLDFFTNYQILWQQPIYLEKARNRINNLDFLSTIHKEFFNNLLLKNKKYLTNSKNWEIFELKLTCLEEPMKFAYSQNVYFSKGSDLVWNGIKKNNFFYTLLYGWNYDRFQYNAFLNFRLKEFYEELLNDSSLNDLHTLTLYRQRNLKFITANLHNFA